MRCQNCGAKNSDEYKYCINCGQSLGAGVQAAALTPVGASWSEKVLPKRMRALTVSVAVAVALLAVLILVLVLNANPVAGRWYAQDGTQLIMLQNGKGMTNASGEAGRIHFMYAVGYREPGYVEGQIYETGDADGAWFYLLDGVLEFDGEYYYRHQSANTSKTQ